MRTIIDIHPTEPAVTAAVGGPCELVLGSAATPSRNDRALTGRRLR
jgi:hypothetical protein